MAIVKKKYTLDMSLPDSNFKQRLTDINLVLLLLLHQIILLFIFQNYDKQIKYTFCQFVNKVGL